jgi:NADH dehydrogenase (ubiquinone) 1 alpha subcomplex subunit 9
LRDEESIQRMVHNSDVVINLIGQARGSMNFKPREVNVEGAMRIARICRQAANKPTLVHVSHMSARADAKSKYMQSKYEGEQAVKKELEDAIIVRPSMLFGQEDYFTAAIGEYARYGLATTEGGKALKHPLYVSDLSEGLVRICQDRRHFTGRTFELLGPEALTWRQVLEIFRYYLVQPDKTIHDLPRWMFLALARVLSWEWRNPSFLPDDLRVWESDEIGGAQEVLGFEHLGMRQLLTTLDEAGNNMVRFYRRPKDLYTIVNPRVKPEIKSLEALKSLTP